VCHSDLVTDRHEAPSEVVVVLGEKAVGYHHVIDILEDQRSFGLVSAFRFEEGEGVVAPVTARV
jgi:hypothetical protein